ncbi:hypothetical protein [Undibacterium sp. Ji49W]|uniref:hypothetical protein n=1 Tax=Undibacterium sp. Ji49W TaxID=3413040 RepID=UPI003BF2115B
MNKHAKASFTGQGKFKHWQHRVGCDAALGLVYRLVYSLVYNLAIGIARSIAVVRLLSIVHGSHDNFILNRLYNQLKIKNTSALMKNQVKFGYSTKINLWPLH